MVMSEIRTYTTFSIVLALAMLFIGFSANAQTYILNEDFSSADGTTPPADWQIITDVGQPTDLWHFDNPGNQAINYPMTGKFAMFDSRAISYDASAEDVLLESKYIDCSGSGNILLIFHHTFKAATGAKGTLEVWGWIFMEYHTGIHSRYG